MTISDIEPGQKDLPELEVPLHGQRHPSMIEADVPAAAHIEPVGAERYFKVHLKHPLDRRQSLAVGRIYSDVASADGPQGPCGQLITRAGNDAGNLRTNRRCESFRKPDVHAIGARADHIDRGLWHDGPDGDLLKFK